MTIKLYESINLGRGVTMDVYRIPIDSVILGIAHDIFERLQKIGQMEMPLVKVLCNGHITYCESPQDFAELCTGLQIPIDAITEAICKYFQSGYYQIVIQS